MNANALTFLQFCGGADLGVLRQCRQGVQMMKTVQGAICVIVAVLSSVFAANTWGSIYDSLLVGLGVAMTWVLLIGGINWMVGYTRDRPVRNRFAGLLGLMAILTFYVGVTGVNLTFALMQVFRTEVADVQREQKAERFRPLVARLDGETAAREAGIRRLNSLLDTATTARDSGMLSNQRRFDQAVTEARQKHDSRVAQLEGAVLRLQEGIEGASRRLSGEVSGEQVIKGGAKTTGIRGDGNAAQAVRAEIAKLTELLATATTSRDEQVPVLVAELSTTLDRLAAERDAANRALSQAHAAAVATNAAGKAEALRVWEVAKATYDRDVAQMELVTQDGFKTRFNALRGVLLDDPWSMAPFVLLIFFLETLPFWFTFTPAKEYHERLRLQDLQTSADIARMEQNIERPTPTLVSVAEPASEEARRNAA